MAAVRGKNLGPSDTTAPTCTIAVTGGSPNSTLPLPITFTLSEVSTDFAAGDVTVAGGTIANFAGSGTAYTAEGTPSTPNGTMTFDVAANAFHDAAGNGNLAATQLSVVSSAFILADEFLDTLAAGSVNGTAATPGPGTRNVLDVGSHITVSGGSVVINTGTGVDNQTGIWLTITQALTRAAGLVARCDVLFPGISTTTFWGLTTALNAGFAGYNNVGLLSITTGGNGIAARKTAAASSPRIAFVSTNTTYIIHQILRLTGRFIFVDYKLVWMDAWDATASLHHGARVTGVGDKINVGRFSTRQSVYSVLADASDSFNRANGALGNTDGAGHAEANSGGSVAWADAVGTWAIATNVAAASALAGGIAVATVETSKQDELIRCDTTRVGGNVGLVTRYTDASNYIYAYHDGTNATIRKVLAGVDSQVLAPVAATYAAGAKLMLRCDGNDVWMYYNELFIGRATDASLPTGTKHGLYSTNTGNTFENFFAFPVSGYTALTES
jgi:hypothetical protein